MFHLTISADDLDRFMSDHTPGKLSGWVRAGDLGGRRPVDGGHFNLFVDQNGHPYKRMYYRLHFKDGAGHPLTLVGHKEVRDERGFDVVARHLHALYADPGRPRGGGRGARGGADRHRHPPHPPARLRTPDTTFRVRPAHRLDAIGRFGAIFAGHLWKVYGGRAGR